jgi:uncharacterized protein YndB with AHSA1/START domain
MSAQVQTPILIPAAQFHRSEHEHERPQALSVRTSVTFSAAPSRLLNAFTIPEYIETWLTPPDADEINCSGNPEIGETLSIELRCGVQPVRNIFADYRNISPQDIHIHWYVRSRTSLYVSQLRISLRLTRADTLLRIRHTGFANPNEWNWHQELWRLSVAKMQILIR